MIILPWPSKDLSPNARIHWARRAKAVQHARHDASVAAYLLADDARTFWYDYTMTVGAGSVFLCASLVMYRFLWERGSTPDKPPEDCQ